MVAVLGLPLVVPTLPPELRAAYSETCTATPFLLLAIWTFRRRLAGAEEGERRFWNSMTAAAACWIGQQALLMATYTREDLSVALSLLDELLYVGLYLFMVLALDVQPHLRLEGDPPSALPVLRRVGTVVFAFGLLTYVVVVPATLDPDAYWTAIPSLTLYLLLDLYLVHRALRAFSQSTDRRWRHIYGWLLATCISWLVLDAVEALLWMEILPWLDPGTPWDLPWFLPLVLLVLTGRAGIAAGDLGESPRMETDRRPRQAASLDGPPILLAMLVPLLHFTAYGLELFDPSERQAHELVALSLLLVLGGLAFLYQRALEIRGRRLESERLEALALIEHQAYHDPLTALPNRRLLQDRFDQARAQADRRGEKLALVYLDLDGFKAINDSSGHAAGDELLRQIGQRLTSRTRASDTLARVGGDEFVVMATDVETREAATEIAIDIPRCLSEPFVVDGVELTVAASVGVSLYPDDGDALATLLRLADAAMYEAKAGGTLGKAPPEHRSL